MINKYRVTVEGTYRRTVDVEAECADDAVMLANDGLGEEVEMTGIDTPELIEVVDCGEA